MLRRNVLICLAAVVLCVGGIALAKAVKVAREEANSKEAPAINIADGIFNYLLG